MSSIMKSLRLIFTILILCIWTISSFPAKPLNERSTELAWQAWLLIDENQNKHDLADGSPRRRITPKSVFVVPTFSPQALPQCSEGYRSDSMGRCTKIIEFITKEGNLDFLLEKLNTNFGVIGNYDSEEPTPGPFQVKIPLDGNTEIVDEQEEEDDSAGIAIVIAPIRSGLNNGNNVNVTAANMQNIAGILGVRTDQVATIQHLETSEFTTSASTYPESTTKLESTTQEPNALFYFDPNQKTTNMLSTRFALNTDDGGLKTTFDVKRDTTNTLPMDTSGTTRTVSTTLEGEFSSTIIPTTETGSVTSSTLVTTDGTISTEPNTLPTTEFITHHDYKIKFPSETSPHFVKFPDDTFTTSSGLSRVVDITASEGQLYTSNINGDVQVRNHRNRDRHSDLFRLPANWDEKSEKPLVLRFSRRHGFIDTQTLKGQTFHRKVAPGMFGFTSHTRTIR